MCERVYGVWRAESDSPSTSTTHSLALMQVRRVTALSLNEDAESVQELVQGEVLTVAGSGSKGFSDGPARFATFCYPHDVEMHYLNEGAAVLLTADFDNNCLRRVFLVEGVGEHVSCWAGSNIGTAGLKDGRVQDALFNHPGGLATSLPPTHLPISLASTTSLTCIATSDNADVFVADTYNHCVRMISHHNGHWLVKTIAGNGEKGFRDAVGEGARFNCPTGIVLGPFGDVFVADFSNHAIRMLRKESSGSWRVSTLVGKVAKGVDGAPDFGVCGYVDGTLDQGRLNRPHGVTYDADFDTIYVADCMNNRVRTIKGNYLSTLI